MISIYLIILERIIAGRVKLDAEAVAAFEEMNSKVLSLSTVDWDKEFHLHTDASDIGVGAVLSQTDADGNRKVVMYSSHKLSEPERRWTTFQKEFNGVLRGVKDHHYYLYGRKFVLHVDNKPLKDRIKNSINKTTEGWAVYLADYNFTVEHTPGDQNEFADYLSRLKSYEVGPYIEMDSIERRTIQDISPNADEYSEEEKQILIDAEHKRGHPGVEAMFHSLQKQGYQWPKMRIDLTNLTKKCHKCLRFNPMTAIANSAKIIRVDTPGTRWHADSLFMGPDEADGITYTHAFQITDVATMYTWVFPHVSTTSAEAAESIVKTIMQEGPPKSLHMDGGPEFKYRRGEVIQLVNEALRVEQIWGVPYNSQGNTAAEKSHDVLLRILRKLKDKGKGWVSALPYSVLAYNTHYDRVRDATPFFLQRGYAFPGFGDFQNAATESLSLAQSVKSIQERAEIMRSQVWPAYAARVNAHKEKIAERENQHAIVVDNLKRGQIVYLKAEKNRKKLEPKFDGPFKVNFQVGHGAYVLTNVKSGEVFPREVSIRKLKLAEEPDEQDLEDSDEEDDQLDQQTLEQIAITEDENDSETEISTPLVDIRSI